MAQFLLLDELAGDPCGHTRLAWRDDDPYSRVTTSSHGTSSGVHHETHQEAAKIYKKMVNVKESCGIPIKISALKGIL